MKDVIENLDYWDRVIITDLAINEELLEMIKVSKNPEKIRVFDHHKCDLKNLPENIIITKYSPIYEGKLTCATELYFNFLMNDPILIWLRLVEMQMQLHILLNAFVFMILLNSGRLVMNLRILSMNLM